MRLITWKELSQIVPFTRQHISRLEKRKLFPQRRKPTGHTVFWVYDEVMAWLEQRPDRGNPRRLLQPGPKPRKNGSVSTAT